jgi:hypothetical protein
MSRPEGFAPGTIQLPFRDRAEATAAADTLSGRGFETSVVEWEDGWWIASINGPKERLESEREALVEAYGRFRPS